MVKTLSFVLRNRFGSFSLRRRDNTVRVAAITIELRQHPRFIKGQPAFGSR